MSWRALSDYLSPECWGEADLRSEKTSVFNEARRRMNRFRPVRLGSENANAPIQVLDFFSGAGGMSLGFASINTMFPFFKMLGGCDINRVSAETYSANYGTQIFNDDIKRLAYTRGALSTEISMLGFRRNRPTVLVGCAPCQGFSSHRKKDWWQEEDDRNNLVMAFMEIVRIVKPVAVVMENVPEFLSNRYWDHFAAANATMRDLGYTVKASIYNAAEFGVPQERFRSVVLAMRKNFVLPAGMFDKEHFRTVRDAIGDLPPVEAGVPSPNDPMHRSARHNAKTISVIRKVPHNGGSRPVGIGPRCLDRVKGFSDVYGRLSWDCPSITVTHYARNPASGRYTHPEQDRGLTAREAARLQSFPDGFRFTGKMDDIYRQIGEAVPPLLAIGVITDLLVELISKEPTQEELRKGPASIVEPVSSSYSSVIAGIKMSRRRTS